MASKKRPIAEQIQEADMRQLFALASFRRFLLRVYNEAGIGESAYGSEDRYLNALEGRRSLGFDIFRWCDEATSLPPRSALKAALAEDLQPPGDSDDDRNTDDLDDDDRPDRD